MKLLGKLRPSAHSVKKRKRVGRGLGSGHGKTACHGHKGQRARSGTNRTPSFEGGQMPLNRRLPKRGFVNIFRKEYAILNLDDISRLVGDDNSVDVAAWVTQGHIKRAKDGVKVLGRGGLNKALTIRAHKFSQNAREKIITSGGAVEEIQ